MSLVTRRSLLFPFLISTWPPAFPDFSWILSGGNGLSTRSRQSMMAPRAPITGYVSDNRYCQRTEKKWFLIFFSFKKKSKASTKRTDQEGSEPYILE